MTIRGFIPSFTPAKPVSSFQAPVAPSNKGSVQQSAPQPRSVDSFTPAAAAPKLALLGLGQGGTLPMQGGTVQSATPVAAPSGSGERVQLNDYDALLTAIREGNLQNADIRVPMDLSVLREFRSTGHENETYDQFVDRLRGDSNLAHLLPGNEALLDAIHANPSVNWNGLLAGQDLSGAVFHTPVDYVNFDHATGTNVTFTEPVNAGWFGNADLPGVRFEDGLANSNFTGARLEGASFAGTLTGNGLNGSYLARADFTGVSATGNDNNDFAFARLDGAQFSAGTDWGGSVFTGAVTRDAVNAPAGEPLMPPLVFDAAVVERLGGAAHINELASRGELLPALQGLGEPYASAVNALLPESWRSYVADALGDGGDIKSSVYDAVDSRYGGYERTTPPTLAHLHGLDANAAVFIDTKLAELLLAGGQLDDPMRLETSTQGRTFEQWQGAVTSGTTTWYGHPGTYTDTPTLASFTIPRETLHELYARLESLGFAGEAAALRNGLDAQDSFNLQQLFASTEYPHAARVLYEIWGGTGS